MQDVGMSDIRLVTSMNAIDELFAKAAKILFQRIQYNLSYLGTSCVTRVRDRTGSESWYDQTGNLRSSIGFAIYSYGQKQIFYTYSKQNVNYALAKVNTTYNGYDIGDAPELERPVVNSMNSNIKKMIADGTTSLLILGEDGGYEIRNPGEGVYVLLKGDATHVCTAGEGTVKIGTYSSVGKSIEWAGNPVEGLEEAAKQNCKGKTGSFEYDGTTYSYERGVAKSYELSAELDGVSYTGENPGGEFESALEEAIASSAPSFEYDGNGYLLNRQKSLYDVYRIDADQEAKVYTDYTLDTVEVSGRVSDSFKADALMAAYGSGTFTDGQQTYTVVPREGAPTTLNSIRSPSAVIPARTRCPIS